MPQYVLYACVEGSDLDLVAPILEARLKAFVSGRRRHRENPMSAK
jgi:hypothetical protein